MPSISDIIVERILSKAGDKRQAWEKDFLTSQFNWATRRQYNGWNAFLLDKGEYVSYNQLMGVLDKVNIALCQCLGLPSTLDVDRSASREEANNFMSLCNTLNFTCVKIGSSKFRVTFLRASPQRGSGEIATYWRRRAVLVSQEEYEQNKGKFATRYVKEVKNGKTYYYKVSFALRYHTVFPIGLVSGVLTVKSAYEIMSTVKGLGFPYADMPYEKFKTFFLNSLDIVTKSSSIGYSVEDGDVIKLRLLSKAGHYIDERASVASRVEPVDIIRPYLESTGIILTNEDTTSCYFSKTGNKINLVPVENFKTKSGYFRTCFHEMIHSTGTKERLNRESFIEYRKLRSEEEVVAEVGALFLSSFCRLSNDVISGYENSMSCGIDKGKVVTLESNSDSYILGWGKWIVDNSQAFLTAVGKAKVASEWVLEQAGFEASKGYFDNDEQSGEDSESVEEKEPVFVAHSISSDLHEKLESRMSALFAYEKRLMTEFNSSCEGINASQITAGGRDEDGNYYICYKYVNKREMKYYLVLTLGLDSAQRVYLQLDYGNDINASFKKLVRCLESRGSFDNSRILKCLSEFTFKLKTL